MMFGYAYVSIQSQNPDRQLDVLKGYGVSGDHLYVEKISSMVNDRPKLQKLQQFLCGGDIFVIESFSRLDRSLKDLLAIVDHFEKHGVKVVNTKEQIDTCPSNWYASNNGRHGCANSNAILSLRGRRKDLILLKLADKKMVDHL